MMTLDAGRPNSASNVPPTGAPQTPPSQKLVCPRENNILIICQGLASFSDTLEKMTGTPAHSTLINVTLPANRVTR